MSRIESEGLSEGYSSTSDPQRGVALYGTALLDYRPSNYGDRLRHVRLEARPLKVQDGSLSKLSTGLSILDLSELSRAVYYTDKVIQSWSIISTSGNSVVLDTGHMSIVEHWRSPRSTSTT